MTSAEDQFLLGGGGAMPAFNKNTPLNVEVGGKVLDRRLTQQTEYKPGGGAGEPKWWDEAKTQPRMQLEVTVQTSQRDNPDDDGRRRHFVKGDLQYRTADAVRAVNAPGIQIGGEFYAARTGKGSNDEWLHRVRYVPVTDTFLGADGNGQTAAPVQNGGATKVDPYPSQLGQNGAPATTQSVPTPGMAPGSGYVTPPAPAAAQPPATTAAQPPAAAPDQLTEAELAALSPEQRAAVPGMLASGVLTVAQVRLMFAAQLQGVA